VRLLAEEPKYVTFGEAYEMHHARHGREADIPITFFKESLDKAILTPDMPAQVCVPAGLLPSAWPREAHHHAAAACALCRARPVELAVQSRTVWWCASHGHAELG
jgi:hypothetical protein